MIKGGGLGHLALTMVSCAGLDKHAEEPMGRTR